MKSVKGLVVVLMCVCAATSFGLNVSISGGNATNDQPLIDFITNNFDDVSVTYGNYSNPVNIPVGTDVFMVGRSFNSWDYANATNSAAFNALSIPVVAFSSYLTRPDSGRWGWHTGGAVDGGSVAGAETTVTAAGATVFGVAEGTVDWFTEPAGGFWATGGGTVGGGDILATMGGNILAAGWNAGDLPGSGLAFGGNRLLFNIPQVNSTTEYLPDTAAGKQAMIDALEAYTTLVAIPEPATMAILGLGALVLRRKR